METKAYMYVLECADGSLYTGYTTDVEKRLKTHNAGKGLNTHGLASPLNFFTKNPIQINPLRCLPKLSLKRNRARQS